MRRPFPRGVRRIHVRLCRDPGRTGDAWTHRGRRGRFEGRKRGGASAPRGPIEPGWRGLGRSFAGRQWDEAAGVRVPAVGRATQQGELAHRARRCGRRDGRAPAAGEGTQAGAVARGFRGCSRFGGRLRRDGGGRWPFVRAAAGRPAARGPAAATMLTPGRCRGDRGAGRPLGGHDEAEQYNREQQTAVGSLLAYASRRASHRN